jgi:hypothetical protein
MKLYFFFFLFAVFAANLFSQWSSNPAVNLKVCDTTNAQELVKISPTTDGGCYISWFDTRGGSYAVYLQRLDVLGNKLFASGGLLVSNHSQNSSLVDYDMTTDASNNAVITFTDIRNGGTINPFAYLISPTGTFLWGPDGVNLTDSINSFQPNPKIVATSDGNYIFTWRIGSGPQKLAMQKLNLAGVKQWGTSPMLVTSGTAENYDWVNEVAAENGNIIMYWAGYMGNFITAANYKLYTQKFASNGTRVWNSTEDTVYSLGHVSGFYNPRIFSDGNNGAVYCWHDDRNLTSLSTGYIQRQNSAGQILFPVNGSAVSTNASDNHFDPVAVYVPANGETYAIFQETNGGQTTNGMFGQRFSASGTRLWPDAGQPFIPLADNQQSAMWICVKDTNIICSYEEQIFGSNHYLVKAFRTGPSGVLSWGGSILTASSVLSAKVRMNAAINQIGMSMFCWADNRQDANGVYAQNINYDGSFGPIGIININSNTPYKFSLEQNYPNPFNPSTIIKFSLPNPSEGGAVNTKLVVYDVLGREVVKLVNAQLNPGTYEVSWDASNFSSGVYFYKLDAGDFTAVKKLSLVK